MVIGKNIKIRAIRENDIDTLLIFLSDLESKGQYLPVEIQSEVNFRKEFNVSGFITKQASRYILTSFGDDLPGLIWAFTSVSYFDAVEIGYQIFEKK